MKKGLSILAVFVLAMLAAHICLAIDLKTNLTQAGTELGQTDDGTSLPQRIGGILKIVTGILGIIFVILVVYAGVMWMTAGGDAGTVKKAKDHITNGVIGLIISLLAYALTAFIVDQITTNVLTK